MSYQKPNPSPKVILKQPSANNYVDGLEIRNGRLMNLRPPSVMGIEQAAMYRKQMKKQYKMTLIKLVAILLIKDKKLCILLNYNNFRLFKI